MVSAEMKKRNDFLYHVHCEYSEKTEVLRHSDARRIAKNRMILSMMPKTDAVKDFRGE